VPLALADEVIEQENLLQCECRLLAQSGVLPPRIDISGFGAKRK
jgi:hypothetical protein